MQDGGLLAVSFLLPCPVLTTPHAPRRHATPPNSPCARAGSRTNVLHAAGITRPRAVCVCYPELEAAKGAVELLASEFPGVPLYACARDFR